MEEYSPLAGTEFQDAAQTAYHIALKGGSCSFRFNGVQVIMFNDVKEE